MAELDSTILKQRVADLEHRYLMLTNEMQIVLGAMRESKMYLEYISIPQSGPYAFDSLINRLERAVKDDVQKADEPVAVNENTK